jgi:anti-anti-sigma regulatory factor
MLKIRRIPDGTTIVLTVSGRLDAGNVSELCKSLDTIPAGGVVVLDLADLVLADRDVVRLLKEFEARDGVAIRNCPAYIRIWMAAKDIQ